MSTYEKVVKNFNRFFASIGAVFLFIIMFAINLDVSGRIFFNQPVYGTLGLIRTLLVFLIFLSIGFAQVRKAHIRVGFLIKRMKPDTRQMVIILGLIYDFVIIAMLSYGGFKVAYKSFVTREAMSGIINFPVWPGRYAVAVGLLLLLAQYPVDIINYYRQYKEGKKAISEDENSI